MPVTTPKPAARAIGIDFGTTNSVIATARADGSTPLVKFAAPGGPSDVFRSALCFWQDDAIRGGLGHEAGPWAIAEFLDFPEGCRFIQSFKSLAADALFETASLFDKRRRRADLSEVVWVPGRRRSPPGRALPQGPVRRSTQSCPGHPAWSLPHSACP